MGIEKKKKDKNGQIKRTLAGTGKGTEKKGGGKKKVNC